MEAHPYGWLSLAPPVVAVLLAIVTRRVLLSLLVGIYAGALVTTGWEPLQAAYDLAETHLWPTFTQPDKLRLFAFTMTMGATIGLLHASGGMRGLVGLLTPLARGRRSGQLTGWAMGLVVFFDDYANTLLLGGALRPVFDRLKISREKLAYLVDSTAAPVAGVALISTWIAVEIAYVQDGLDNLPGGAGEGMNAFGLFAASIPYRFYVLQALAFVPLVAVMGRDFGPMLSAERRAAEEPELPTEGVDEFADTTNHWVYAAIPLAVLLTTIVGLLYATGRSNLAANGEAPSAEGWLHLRDVFGAADSGVALMYGSLAGLATAVLSVRLGRLMESDQVRAALVRGVLFVLPAVGILWFASSLSRLTSNKSVDGQPTITAYEYSDHRLYTGDYLQQTLLGSADTAEPGGAFAVLLPTVVFLLASVTAFCTGTSFGTMGLLIPMVIPLAFAVADPTAPGGDPLFLAALGGVLAGAIFGDHCSPISDTTILSSQASGCDHVAHVRTQLPYAMVTATVAVLLGTLPVGLGVPVWVLLPVQTATLVAVLYFVGKRVA
ncbi:Malate-2H(+)/Na(+)-lactate antiporter [Pseudobythopirellula maris]|uniref:Malate-2H(+)/Na(+)-lactate antiporter n=1 Tax=Pseudobythopirellula maris TaxID=2527991 RepID=A0A5C5ZWK6_9BACT|nr:Na+/H+ antiporter NhaC family protein [Pseudobythopirellula maris]TWT90653.1 Malate-2H(+)/Na(+)-lactate antiporter [Pseudobythopirellula maris]